MRFAYITGDYPRSAGAHVTCLTKIAMVTLNFAGDVRVRNQRTVEELSDG
jgi:hypothetical protein